MILTAHQPVYLPWLGLFHKIALADKFIFFDQVQYVPKDWISRNFIKTSQGQLLLTVPVLTSGYLEKTIAQIEINNEVDWRKKHFKSIVLSYKKTPYFNKYIDFFEDLYNKEWFFLADLNLHILTYSLTVLGIKTPVERASKYNFLGVKSDLVLNMCIQLNANIYIFGALGKDYADIDKFNKKGITPIFQTYHHPTYKQLHGTFRSNMSIIDLLFNEGDNALEIIMQDNLKKENILTSRN